jgi:hypothetical protein
MTPPRTRAIPGTKSGCWDYRLNIRTLTLLEDEMVHHTNNKGMDDLVPEMYTLDLRILPVSQNGMKYTVHEQLQTMDDHALHHNN